MIDVPNGFLLTPEIGRILRRWCQGEINEIYTVSFLAIEQKLIPVGLAEKALKLLIRCKEAQLRKEASDERNANTRELTLLTEILSREIQTTTITATVVEKVNALHEETEAKISAITKQYE